MFKKSEVEIYRFKTKNKNDYIFDNVTGIVVPCTDELYYIIVNFNELDENQIISNLGTIYNKNISDSKIYYKYVENLIDQGCFYRKDLKFYADPIDHKKISKTEMSQLILILTENCNMRCKYCIYSGHYQYIKSYTDKDMSMEVAKRSIDLYMKLHESRLETGYKGNPTISFYGGEPLLKFKLLIQIVQHCKKNGYMPSYNITTNGTIMNKEIINFLIDNNFIVTFSLDGNKEEHNRNRLLKNGKGSFDLVFKNICRLQEEAKKRNGKSIMFNSCYDQYTNLENVVNFFDESNKLLGQNFILFNPIYKYNTDYYNYCDSLYKKNIKLAHFNSLKKLQSNFNDNALKNQYNSPALSYLFSRLNLTYNRPLGVLSSLCGSCTIGSKVAVDPNGIFYLCEKMSQTCPIGDINSGLDFDKANYFQNKFLSIINDKCADCKLSRLCSLCYTNMAKGDDIEFNYEFCKDSKSAIHNQLTTVFSMLELNPNAFDGTSNITAHVDIEDLKTQ